MGQWSDAAFDSLWTGADLAGRAMHAAFHALPHRVQEGLHGLAWAAAAPVPLAVPFHAFYSGNCHAVKHDKDYMCGSSVGLILAVGFPVFFSAVCLAGSAQYLHMVTHGRHPQQPPHNANPQALPRIQRQN